MNLIIFGAGGVGGDVLHILITSMKYKINESNIHLSNICTFENQECCSYRRDGENAGRMYSFMGVRNGFN